ncbi:MAG: helix-hairpin-helix domain-containing protein, partial [Planctomycetia bacterium]|nr:helix-hairpin-helix domain-containing protein [Planctomycetia bacterium]
RSEQMPGERYEPNARVRATVFEVKKHGSRVRVILSRIRPHLVQRLFEQEIPEIADGVIEIRSISREAGYRTKIAVWSGDPRVDCVGACVGIRGSRIRSIHEELGGERIDVIPWDDDPLVFIANSLKPAEVDEVILCQMLGRAIVLVREDQLSLAIGRYGQNVSLASKLCGWDIEIMTRDELGEELDRAIAGFSSMDGVTQELAEQLVGEGFLSYADLSVIEPEDLMEIGGLTEAEVSHIVDQADEWAEREENALRDFSGIRGLPKELARRLVNKGILCYADLATVDPEVLMSMGGLAADDALRIVTQAVDSVRKDKAVRDFSGIPGLTENVIRKLTGKGILSFADLVGIGPEGLMKVGGFTAGEAARIVARAADLAEEERVDETSVNPVAGSTEDGGEGKGAGKSVLSGSVAGEPVSSVEGSVS